MTTSLLNRSPYFTDIEVRAYDNAYMTDFPSALFFLANSAHALLLCKIKLWNDLTCNCVVTVILFQCDRRV